MLLLCLRFAEIPTVLLRLTNEVVVAEAAMRWNRKFGSGNNFQRDPDEYIDIFKSFNFKCLNFVHAKSEHFPYYIDFLHFKKEE